MFWYRGYVPVLYSQDVDMTEHQVITYVVVTTL